MAIGTHELVGREEELGSLRAALDSLPAVAVVAGDAGIGKTALWSAAVEEARARGFRILSCRPSEAEARYSFSGLTDLLGTAVPEGLPAPQQKALETALALTAAERPVDEGVLAFAFLGAVRTLAAEGSVVLAVDDVQWLDQPSLALLRYAISRFEDERVAVFLTARGEVPLWLARVDGTLELELRPLSVGALHELLRRRLDAALPRPVLLRIWEASGGNPFFALELARALQRRGGRIEPGAELPVPETLEELVLERLRALTPEADEVCRVVAAASEPTVPLVEQIADAAEPAWRKHWRRASWSSRATGSGSSTRCSRRRFPRDRSASESARSTSGWRRTLPTPKSAHATSPWQHPARAHRSPKPSTARHDRRAPGVPPLRPPTLSSRRCY